MKIAIPTRDDEVDAHFGHCAYYTVFNINDEKKVTGSELIASPQGCGCKSNIAEILRNEGVSTMLAGNMGEGALQILNHFDIQVIRGCTGSVKEVVEAYLNGSLTDSGIGCEHHHNHSGDHSC